MKTITKEINVLEIEDIEKAVSDFFGEEVKLNELDCTLTYWIAFPDFSPDGMSLKFNSPKGICYSADLFYDKKGGCYYLDGKLLGLSAHWLPVNEIFAFDVSEFKSFVCLTTHNH